jgi:hypothetical protein
VNPWHAALAPVLDVRAAPVTIFFRDDDGGWDDVGLQRLVGIFTTANVPLDLALIPAALSEPLAQWLSERSGPALGLHQHGFAHANHERTGRKCEFGPARDLAAQRGDIADGAVRLRHLLRGCDPIFTPPWNRCTQDTARVLAELGFQALSRDDTAGSLTTSLQSLPVTLDWMKHRLDSDPDLGVLSRTLRAQLLDRHCVGIMLHHAVMVESDYDILCPLLELLRSHDRCRCVPMRALIHSPAEAAA